MDEERTSLAWIAVKNSLTTTRPGKWIFGVFTTQKHWRKFVVKFVNSFRLVEVSLQGPQGDEYSDE